MSRGRDALLKRSAPIFAALGDETRLRLVVRLGVEGPLSIARLQEGGSITRQAVTKHLQTLAGSGLVRDRWLGRERRWELAPGGLDEARACLDRISAQWDVALASLKEFVERK